MPSSPPSPPSTTSDVSGGRSSPTSVSSPPCRTRDTSGVSLGIRGSSLTFRVERPLTQPLSPRGPGTSSSRTTRPSVFSPSFPKVFSGVRTSSGGTVSSAVDFSRTRGYFGGRDSSTTGVSSVEIVSSIVTVSFLCRVSSSDKIFFGHRDSSATGVPTVTRVLPPTTDSFEGRNSSVTGVSSRVDVYDSAGVSPGVGVSSGTASSAVGDPLRVGGGSSSLLPGRDPSWTGETVSSPEVWEADTGGRRVGSVRSNRHRAGRVGR